MIVIKLVTSFATFLSALQARDLYRDFRRLGDKLKAACSAAVSRLRT